MFGGDLVDRGHVGGLAVDANGHDGFCLGCDGCLELGRIHIPSIGFYIDEDRLSAEKDDHLGGGNPGVWNSDDFITGFDAEGHHCDEQGISAAGYADAVLDADVSGETFLEFLNLGAHDVLTVFEDAGDGGVDLRLDAVLLRFEIDEGDHGISGN